MLRCSPHAAGSLHRSAHPIRLWLRAPKEGEERPRRPHKVADYFAENVNGMSAALAAKLDADLLVADTPHVGECKINLSDTASMQLDADSIDLVLTSPPYCTRIDYTAATRIELAVLGPLLRTSARALGKQMIGSTQVPATSIEVHEKWGRTCARFLDALHRHPSRASDGYYYRTHLDYFDKMSRSIGRMSDAMKPGSRAILVVQDRTRTCTTTCPRSFPKWGKHNQFQAAQGFSSSIHVRHQPRPSVLCAPSGRSSRCSASSNSAHFGRD
jgi:hypothetical protein